MDTVREMWGDETVDSLRSMAVVVAEMSRSAALRLEGRNTPLAAVGAGGGSGVGARGGGGGPTPILPTISISWENAAPRPTCKPTPCSTGP